MASEKQYTDIDMNGQSLLNVGTVNVANVTVSSATSAAVNATSLKAYAPTTKLLPIGGTIGQVPVKNSSTDGDISWTTPTDVNAKAKELEAQNWFIS